MHMRNKPPIFVPQVYRVEIEKLSKAALMDVVWDYAQQCSGGGNSTAAMAELRERIDIIQTHRKQA